ncbi:MAG TPA: hypothetical protein VFI56_23225 [Vicinamibacterales bacterium]|nr:hypothetical protein [Vicinamibacterales bacterium]
MSTDPNNKPDWATKVCGNCANPREPIFSYGLCVRCARKSGSHISDSEEIAFLRITIKNLHVLLETSTTTPSVERSSHPFDTPIPMRLPCPGTIERDGQQIPCGVLHVDEGEFATKPHHTHACQACGLVWRPALVPTVGVLFLPGYKNVKAPQPIPAATELSSVRIRLRRDVVIAGVRHIAGTIMSATRKYGTPGIEFGHGAVFPLDSKDWELVK